MDIEIGSEQIRLVGGVVGAAREQRVEPADRRRVAAEEVDQPLSVVGHEGRVLERRALVQRLPEAEQPLRRVERREEGPVGCARADRARGWIPQPPPAARAGEPAGGVAVAPEALRHLADRKVVVGVLHRARGRARLRQAHVPEPRVVAQVATLDGRMLRLHRRVLHERPVRQPPIDAGQALHDGVRDHDVRVGPNLRHAGGARHARVGKPAGVAVGVEQRAHDRGLALRIDQPEQRVLRAERVPERQQVLVVGLAGAPPGVVAREVVRHQQRVVERRREDAALLAAAARDRDATERMLPGRPRRTARARVAPARDVPPGGGPRAEREADRQLNRAPPARVEHPRGAVREPRTRGAVEAGDEPEPVAARVPAAREGAAALERPRPRDVERRAHHPLRELSRVDHRGGVDRDPRLAARGKHVTVHGAHARGGEPGGDPAAIQKRPVAAGKAELGVERGGRGAQRRRDPEVPVLAGSTRAGEVRLAEPEQRLARRVAGARAPSRCPVPAARTRRERRRPAWCFPRRACRRTRSRRSA